MKKYIYILLGTISLVLAFPPTDTSFDELRSNKGELIANSLKVIPIQKSWACEYGASFSGEITLSGVLERADNEAEGDIESELRFYPDNNLKKYLPFLYAPTDDIIVKNDGENSTCDFSKVKFEPLHFGVLLRTDKLSALPRLLDKRFYGRAGMRALVTLRDYSYSGDGDAGHEAEATLIDFKPLGEIKIKESNIHFPQASYASKDSYINLRESPNGKIIRQILAKDMQEGARIFLAAELDLSCEDMRETLKGNAWLKVWYLPPNYKNPLDAIYGFIHSSQIKVEC